jgi:hypothetical protein
MGGHAGIAGGVLGWYWVAGVPERKERTPFYSGQVRTQLFQLLSKEVNINSNLTDGRKSWKMMNFGI